jgi:hypothetical protein
MNVIFNEHLHIPYQLTESIDEFKQADIKISYAKQPIENEVFIWQHTLLTETGIKEQIIDKGLFENEPIFFQSPNNQSFIPFDVFALSFYLLIRYEEYLPHQKDKYGRFLATESIAYKMKFLQKPLVDMLVLKFAKKLQTVFPNLTYNLPPSKHIATYDIDNAYAYKHKGVIRTVGGFLKQLFHLDFKDVTNRISVLTGKKQDPFDTYEYIESIRQKYNLETYYFILFTRKSKHDRSLHPKNKKFQKLINKLHTKGNVGIHPSFVSSFSTKKLTQEINSLANILQENIVFCRSHYLLLDFPKTYNNFITNGIKVDFSLGYAEQIGFRASTSKPFPFFDLSANEETSLKLYPFAYMEETLQRYMKLSNKEAFTTIKKLIDVVKFVQGTFISLWHNENLDDKRKKIYEQSLEYFFATIH